MSFEDGKERRRRPEVVSDSDTSARPKSRRKRSNRETPEIGQALRSVYEHAVNEAIPPEMLDLLGKLG